MPTRSREILRTLVPRLSNGDALQSRSGLREHPGDGTFGVGLDMCGLKGMDESVLEGMDESVLGTSNPCADCGRISANPGLRRSMPVTDFDSIGVVTLGPVLGLCSRLSDSLASDNEGIRIGDVGVGGDASFRGCAVAAVHGLSIGFV